MVRVNAVGSVPQTHHVGVGGKQAGKPYRSLSILKSTGE